MATLRDPCAQQQAIGRLRTAAQALVRERRVPPALQEPLMSGVNALVADQPTCLPDVSPPPATTTAPPSAPVTRGGHKHPGHAGGHGHDHGPAHGHGHGHGHGD